MKAFRFNKLLAAAIGISLFIATIEFYPVRELVAALMIFSVLFCSVATALLFLVFVEEAIFEGMTLLEARLVRIRPRNTATSPLPRREPVRRSQWS